MRLTLGLVVGVLTSTVSSISLPLRPKDLTKRQSADDIIRGLDRNLDILRQFKCAPPDYKTCCQLSDLQLMKSLANYVCRENIIGRLPTLSTYPLNWEAEYCNEKRYFAEATYERWPGMTNLDQCVIQDFNTLRGFAGKYCVKGKNKVEFRNLPPDLVDLAKPFEDAMNAGVCNDPRMY